MLLSTHFGLPAAFVQVAFTHKRNPGVWQGLTWGGTLAHKPRLALSFTQMLSSVLLPRNAKEGDFLQGAPCRALGALLCCLLRAARRKLGCWETWKTACTQGVGLLGQQPGWNHEMQGSAGRKD